MYWNNCFFNNFNSTNFFNKILFLENLILFIFSEKIFSYFFTKKINAGSTKLIFSKKQTTVFKTNKHKSIRFNSRKEKYNFTRLWVVKFNNYILLSTFCFFYFKIKKRNKRRGKKNLFIKIPSIFWKKRKKIFLKKIKLSSSFF